MEKRKWIVLNYNLPSEPSRHRVAVWRGLKKLGAVNIQQSMWILGYNEPNYRALRKIAQDVESSNGEALLMETAFFDEKHEERVISLYNDIRDEEYHEFIEKCEEYLGELEKEIRIEKFTFAELEEEEEEFEKMVSWHEKIATRDIFHALAGDRAKERLEQIKKAFEVYSDLVYKHNNNRF